MIEKCEENAKKYLSQNHSCYISSIEELNSELSDVSFKFVEGCTVIKKYDDNLKRTQRYMLSYENKSAGGLLSVSVIPHGDYDFEWVYDVEGRVGAVGALPLYYRESRERRGGKLFYKSVGKIVKGGDCIYVEYESIGNRGKGAFLLTLSDFLS